MIGIQGETALEEVTKSPCDSSLDANSTNAVENRVVTQAINDLSSDLGSKSSASEISGNDAFSKIATLNNRLSANKIGAQVSLKAYTSSSNAYTFSSDGYVEVLMGGGVLGQSIIANIADSNNNILNRVMSITLASGQSGAYGSIFVKKGMKAWVTISSGATNNASAMYRVIGN